MTDLNNEFIYLQNRLKELRVIFTNLLCWKNEMVCHEETILQYRYIALFGKKQLKIEQLQLDIGMLKYRQKLLKLLKQHQKQINLRLIEKEVQDKFKSNFDRIKQLENIILLVKEENARSEANKKNIEKATKIYDEIIYQIHPRIYQSSCYLCSRYLEEANAAYIQLNISELQKIATEVSHIEKHDDISDFEKFKKFVEEVEQNVSKINEQVSTMVRKFPFTHRDVLYDKHWIAAEDAQLSQMINKYETDKIKISEAMILNQIKHINSLN